MQSLANVRYVCHHSPQKFFVKLSIMIQNGSCMVNIEWLKISAFKNAQLSHCHVEMPYCIMDLTRHIGSGTGLCPTAPNHYLNQCWLVMSRVLLHSAKDNSNGNTHEVITTTHFENHTFKVKATSPRGQCVIYFHLKLWDMTSLSLVRSVHTSCFTYI